MINRLLINISSNKTKINEFLLIGIAVTIPFGISFGNISLIVAGVFNIMFFERSNLKKLTSYVIVYPFLFFVILLIWAAFGADFGQGISRADRHFIPVALTIVLINQQSSKLSQDRVLYYFLLAVTLSTFVLLLIFLNGWIMGMPLSELTFHNFTSFFSQHPVYFSLYLSLALIYLVSFGHKGLTLIHFISIPILLLGLILSASKAVLFVDLIGGVIFFLSKSRNSLKLTTITIISLFILVLTMSRVSFLRERFVNGLTFHDKIIQFRPNNDFKKKRQFDYYDKIKLTDLELRYLMARISIYHLFRDNKICTGYGPADTQDYLDYYLYSYNLGPNWFEGFNVHNQYIHILINYGIIVFLLFGFYLIRMMILSIKVKNHIQLSFLLLCAFVFLFEVMLIRNKGIIFFYFFSMLFLTNSYTFENRNIRN